MQEFVELKSLCDELVGLSGVRLAVLIDSNGQLLVASGDTTDVDLAGFASLAAGSVAATGGIAKIMNEQEFSFLFHEGQREKLVFMVIQKWAILVVIFDQSRSLGWVRFQLRKNLEVFEKNLRQLIAKNQQTPSPLVGVSDEELDQIFVA